MGTRSLVGRSLRAADEETWAGDLQLGICGCVASCSNGSAGHNLSVNSSPLISAGEVHDEVFMAVRNLWCSCSN